MKQCCVLLLVLVMATAMFAACTNSGAPEVSPSSQTPEPTKPVFTDAELIGTWSVSQVKDSNGNAAGEEKLKEIGADFTIELTGGGMYIISDAAGREIGQGTYSVAQDKLTLTASGGDTVYTIQDINTILCIAEDGSTTYMTRCCIDTPENEEGEAVEEEAETDEEAEAEASTAAS